jgi:hypothetical protein
MNWQRYQIWQRPPLGCWAHHNQPRCGSLRLELVFLFGSCRAFFGEPCLKEPPPTPMPASVAPRFGGQGAAGGCSCP